MTVFQVGEEKNRNQSTKKRARNEQQNNLQKSTLDILMRTFKGKLKFLNRTKAWC